MKTSIQKWGNSLGIRIPNYVIQKLDLYHGSTLEISVQGNHITLYPKKYNLSDMLDKVTKANLHSKEWEDDIKGKEEW